VGANTLVACPTTAGSQVLYGERELFTRFRETTEEIARLQSILREGRYTSWRIRALYCTGTRRRDHAQAALVRDLIARLYDECVRAERSGKLVTRDREYRFGLSI
jgi:putative transposase